MVLSLLAPSSRRLAALGSRQGSAAAALLLKGNGMYIYMHVCISVCEYVPVYVDVNMSVRESVCTDGWWW